MADIIDLAERRRGRIAATMSRATVNATPEIYRHDDIDPDFDWKGRMDSSLSDSPAETASSEVPEAFKRILRL